jgi:DeoR/GlpR family transcriptional regulator of sugar metabolism
MLANQRREKILELLREDGSAKVTSLSKIFKVSEVTIRHDLEKLERDGLVMREHGGAFLKEVESLVSSFELINKSNMDKKAVIGKHAAGLITDGETIILDSGSTTTEVAKNLIGRKNLTVITNALNIALILGGEPGIEIIMTGGEFKPPTLSLTGQKAAAFFEDVHVNKLFLATAGISLKSGLTYPSLSDIVVKKTMIDVAETVYLVADSTKIGKGALASLGALSLIDYFITDSGITKDHLKVFRDHDIKTMIAQL